MTRPANADSRDSRVELIAAVLANGVGFASIHPDSYAGFVVRSAEAAGLLVLDPDDPALVERIADVLWMLVIFSDRETARDAARAVLAALAPDLPGGSE